MVEVHVMVDSHDRNFKSYNIFSIKNFYKVEEMCSQDICVLSWQSKYFIKVYNCCEFGIGKTCWLMHKGWGCSSHPTSLSDG